MSLKRLKDTTSDLPPEDRSAVERLVAFVAQQQERQRAGRRPTYTVNRLYEVMQPKSMASLARILLALVRSGAVREFIRIEGEDGGGIGDYDSVASIPSEIHDVYSDKTVRVSMNNVQVRYEIANGER